MAKSCVIVGGGFKGLIGAYLLREAGVSVTLIEKAPHLGGIMYSREWNGFVVDNGVQLFDSVSPRLAQLVNEVMDNKTVPISFNYASAFGDVVTPGLAIPDLSNLAPTMKATILYELAEKLAEPGNPPTNLYERFVSMYGKTAADLYDASFSHIYGASAHEVVPDSLRQTGFHRLKFLPDNIALELKKHPELDRRLAAKRVALGKIDDLVSVYPGFGGMREFCVRMTRRLSELGVIVRTNTNITNVEVNPGTGVRLSTEAGETTQADHLVWAQDHGLLAKAWKRDGRLLELTHATPMVLFYFQVPRARINDYTYGMQFAPNYLVFRAAAAGVYGNQVQGDGTTFIIAECPAKIGGEFWNARDSFVERVWNECIAMDLVKPGSTFVNYSSVRVPSTHRFQKMGYEALASELDREIEASRGAIIMPSQEAFSRREIMATMEQVVPLVTGA